MLRNVVIVGGGTAGWMAALAVSARLPEVRVTVIDPDKVPAIGVGESVTGIVQQFIRDPAFGLDMGEFFRRTDATFKLGIWYKNWKGVGTEYLTPIDAPFQFFKHSYPLDSEEFYALAVADGVDLCEEQVFSSLMRTNRTDYIRQDDGGISAKNSTASCQFDALKCAEWIKEVCLSRSDVTHLDDAISGFEQDPQSGAVTNIVTESGRKVGGDFFIDCTGFHRKLFQPAFSPKWIDYSQFIRLDSAIPCPVDYRERQPIPTYTCATALRNGWMWQVPTASRLGIGYVFSSKYASDEQALTELREQGCDPGNSPHIIRFAPGRFDRQWQQNVCTLGLSGGFIEPLEASTIHGMVVQIDLLTRLYLPSYSPEAAPALSAQYNHLLQMAFDDYADFIGFHYQTGRDDTEFWRDYQKPESTRARNLERQELWKHKFPSREDFAPTATQAAMLTSGLVVWFPAISALGNPDKALAKKFISVSNTLHLCRANVARYLQARALITQKGVPHEEAIAHVRGDGWKSPALPARGVHHTN